MWSPNFYYHKGLSEGFSEAQLKNSITQIKNVSPLPGILTLNHFSSRTGIPYQVLRAFVDRSDHGCYRRFSIKKRAGGRRFICVPSRDLMKSQKWISEFILKKVPVHKCSYAFSPGSSILACANQHVGARWLIKMDIQGFFESISEIKVYRAFKSLGYQPLVAFELARITTFPVNSMLSPRWYKPEWRANNENKVIPSYSTKLIGYLPQGAPSSPMLSNVIMKDIDEQIFQISESNGLVYTRYSDDLTFSTYSRDFNRKKASKFILTISNLLLKNGFAPQYRKTKVISPGARKVVLGLQVDGIRPTLRREYKDNLKQHLHYLKKFGPSQHMIKREFDTLWGMKSHIKGLIDHANSIEPLYAREMLLKFNEIDWPL